MVHPYHSALVEVCGLPKYFLFYLNLTIKLSLCNRDSILVLKIWAVSLSPITKLGLTDADGLIEKLTELLGEREALKELEGDIDEEGLIDKEIELDGLEELLGEMEGERLEDGEREALGEMEGERLEDGEREALGEMEAEADGLILAEKELLGLTEAEGERLREMLLLGLKEADGDI